MTTSCNHEPSVCRKCIARHLTSQLKTHGQKNLTCPECRAPLPYASIAKYASPKTFERYDTLAMRDSLSADPHFRWCAAGCGSGQLHLEGASNPLMVCSKCRAKTCFTHQIRWHKGLTCWEHDHPNAPSRGRTVGGVTRKETAQEQGDRLLAESLTLSEAQEVLEEEQSRRRAKKEGEKKAPKKAPKKGKQQETSRKEQEADRKKQEADRKKQEAARKKQEANRKKEEAERKKRAKEEAERKRRAKEEAASLAALTKLSKECPGKCGARIQKRDGCDHMTCKFLTGSYCSSGRQVRVPFLRC